MTTRRGKSVSFLLCVRVGMEWPNIWLGEVALVVWVPVPERATLFYDFLVFWVKTNATSRWLSCVIVYLKRKKKNKTCRGISETKWHLWCFESVHISLFPLQLNHHPGFLSVPFFLSLLLYWGQSERARGSLSIPFSFVIVGSERESARERGVSFMYLSFFLYTVSIE